MTTIKLIPSVMEFDVSLDSASMPSLFNQSMETTIIDQVERHVNGRIPTASDVADNVSDLMRNDRDFCRKIRDWVMESIDYDSITTDIRDNLDYSEISAEILGSENITETLTFAVVSNARFKTQMNNAMQTYIDNMDIGTRVDDKITEMALNMENRIIEQILNTLGNRLITKLDA
jgi:hypothetical protein